MSGKLEYLKSLHEAYKAWKNAKEYFSKLRLWAVFQGLLDDYLTFFFINLGMEGNGETFEAHLRKKDSYWLTKKEKDWYKLVKFGARVRTIRDYDLFGESLNSFKEQILKIDI